MTKQRIENIESVGVQKSSAMEVERDLSAGNRKVELRDNDNDSEEVDEPDGNTQNQKVLSSIYNYLVVLSIILIVFAAFRNSVTW